MKSPAHSRIGPSQAELIWHCPGSVQAQEAAGPRIAGEAAERASDLSRDLTNVIQRNPIPSVLIALGVGFLAAVALRRTTSI